MGWQYFVCVRRSVLIGESMSKHFVAINPLTGSNTTFQTAQELSSFLAKTALDLLLSHTHNAPYSVVTVNADGSETWTAPDGSLQLSPAEMEAATAKWVAEMEAAAAQQNT